MVNPLAKIFERRLQDNMRRHRMDVNLGGRRPAPNCSPSIFEQPPKTEAKKREAVATLSNGDAELFNRFIQDTTVAVAPPPLAKAEEPIEHLELDMAPAELIEGLAHNLANTEIQAKGLQRVPSAESAFFTESESGLSA